MDGLKVCRRCKAVKPVEDFRAQRRTCRPCERIEKSAARARIDRAPVVGGLKTCSKCGEEGACEDFSTDRRASDGRHGWCNTCARAAAMDRYKAEPEKHRTRSRDYRIKMPEETKAAFRGWYVAGRFGLTVEEYDARRAAVEKCAICGTENPGNRGWVLDHCHSSGEVRDFLCTQCNTGLGLFKDDPDRLLAAAMYIMRHQKTLEKLLPGMAER